MNSQPYTSWIEIDTSAIEHNTHAALEICKCRMIAVVKNNAYGFGAVEASRIILKAGASSLAVNTYFEAHELRRAGIDADILILGGIIPEEADQVIYENLIACVYDQSSVELLEARAKALGKKARVHLKVETGLGRFGVFPEEALDFALRIYNSDTLNLNGVYSHLAMADVLNHPLNELQVSRFEHVINSLNAAGIRPEVIHIGSSASVFLGIRNPFNTVRVGEALYGLGTGCDELPFPSQLKRAFTWKARLMSCKQFPAGWGISYGQNYITRKDEWIGVIPVGHGDGFQRASGNQVLIGGKKMPVVGNVAISQAMISLPEYIPPQTEVVLIGKQGSEAIWPEELSKRWSKPLTGVTNIGTHIQRVYLSSQD